MEDAAEGGVAAVLLLLAVRCSVEGRGVDGAREWASGRGGTRRGSDVAEVVVLDEDDEDDSPTERRVFRTKRLLPGRSRSITVCGLGSGVDLPFPLPRNVIVDEEETFLEGRSWI